MRHGLAQLINSEPDLAVCGEAGSSAEGLRAVEKLQPDLVIVDLTLPDKHGLEFIKDLHAMFPGTRVLVLSMHDESLYAERALRAGARGYLMKETAADTLVKAAHRVLAGGIYLSEKMASHLLETHRRPAQAQRRLAAGKAHRPRARSAPAHRPGQAHPSYRRAASRQRADHRRPSRPHQGEAPAPRRRGARALRRALGGECGRQLKRRVVDSPTPGWRIWHQEMP